jgi:hippurate hydrolase
MWSRRRAADGSEDFAFMLEKKPGCYLFIGNGATRPARRLHGAQPGYDFNDEIIAPAAAFWARLVETCLVR